MSFAKYLRGESENDFGHRGKYPSLVRIDVLVIDMFGVALCTVPVAVLRCCNRQFFQNILKTEEYVFIFSFPLFLVRLHQEAGVSISNSLQSGKVDVTKLVTLRNVYVLC